MAIPKETPPVKSKANRGAVTPRASNVIEMSAKRPESKVAARPKVVARSEEIAARAYEIFLARGAGQGHDVDDWLQAERELNVRIRRGGKK